MSRFCTVCAHQNRASIDRRLVANETVRSLSKEYGIPKSTLQRHKVECAGLKFPTAEVRREATQGTVALTLLPSRNEIGGMYLDVRERLHTIIDQAEKQGTGAISVSGLNAVRQTLDSLARLAGHTMSPSQTVNVGVQLNITAADIGAALADRLEGVLPTKVIEAAETVNE